MHSGGSAGLLSSSKASSSACSSSVSTSFSVEIWCCASTRRQNLPEIAPVSDDSAAGVQIGKDIGQSRNADDLFERRGAERRVGVAQPLPGNGLVAADNRVERTKQTDQQDRELKGLRAALKQIILPLH